MATEIIPIRLNEEMFNQLVTGGTIVLQTDNKKYEIRIILADIGYDRIIKAVIHSWNSFEQREKGGKDEIKG